MRDNQRTILLLEEIAVRLVGLAAYFSYPSDRKEWYRIYHKLKANTAAKQYRIRKKIQNLASSNIIKLENNEYQLTQKGKLLLAQLKLDELKIKPKKWDGIWRLVSYDIPSEKKAVRNIFRRKLKLWGFKLVHKSLWVLPWQCENEVAALAHNYNLQENIITMTTKRPPMENRLKKIFGLSD